ncbi:4a-hydroxytetrahydrobiopterin dehydratase [Candidatus Pacearchaeota archaeon]|nr:4a-hydroxytetrahydrobiopterin dehydratase [Candidatus Pacearchaeota archaeon]
MREDIHILNEKEILIKLKEFPDWEYKENKIKKEFKFRDFMDCLAFTVRLAPICEMKDHHPDIHIFYSKILFELQRFDVGGKVTDMDFFIASEIERLYKENKPD